MGLRDWFQRNFLSEREVTTYPLSFDQFLQQVLVYGGQMYQGGPLQTLKGTEVSVPGNFIGLVQGAYKSNGPIFACMLVRMLLFSEARFAFRKLMDGRPGELFGGSDGRNPANRDLQLLRRPWPRGTTVDLLKRAITDADLAGNFYCVRDNDRLRRLRPDWTKIVLNGDRDSYDAEIVGYMYQPGGPGKGRDPVSFVVEQVAHFAPIPDPVTPWVGMSWLNPVITEIEADTQATLHKSKFFSQGATPNMVITGLPATKEQFDRWITLFKEQHEGAENAYKNLFLSGGVDVKVVGADFKQLDFKLTQGAGETRIAAAAGVPPVIVGLSEGLQAATYSNYSQARRRFADGTMWPLWRNFCGSMATLVNEPADAELWIDATDIPFLREDEKDAAEVLFQKSQAIRTLTDGGYQPDLVIDAVTSGDLKRLKHTGLVPVQLQPPGVTEPSPNGNGKVPAEMTPMTGGN
jgi:phage portal protein BeeE